MHCYNYLQRLEGAAGSRFANLPLEQMALALIEYFESDTANDEYLQAFLPKDEGKSIHPSNVTPSIRKTSDTKTFLLDISTLK